MGWLKIKVPFSKGKELKRKFVSETSGILQEFRKSTDARTYRSHQLVVFESFLGLINCDNLELLFAERNCEL